MKGSVILGIESRRKRVGGEKCFQFFLKLQRVFKLEQVVVCRASKRATLKERRQKYFSLVLLVRTERTTVVEANGQPGRTAVIIDDVMFRVEVVHDVIDDSEVEEIEVVSILCVRFVLSSNLVAITSVVEGNVAPLLNARSREWHEVRPPSVKEQVSRHPPRH